MAYSPSVLARVASRAYCILNFSDVSMIIHDKLNDSDFHWFIVRTLPHQERMLAELLLGHQADIKNILEVYCPTHTTVSIERNGRQEQRPLLAGYVFVLSTHKTLAGFISTYYPDGIIIYERRKQADTKPNLLTVPEEQMRFFMDFNENYAEHVIVLERPYSDYAFNPKTNEPNDIVKVVEGPLKGRQGYLTRFRRGRRIVFNMKSVYSDRFFAVSIPDIWNLKVVRLHNAEGDRQTAGTMKERAADLLIGMLQGCGYGVLTLPMFHEIISALCHKFMLSDLCAGLSAKGHLQLSRQLSQISPHDARLLYNLIRYEHDNPGYIKAHWSKLVIRPFLTPTAGISLPDGESETQLAHDGFTETIRKVSITEEVYYPTKDTENAVISTYYAHVGIIRDGSTTTVFANWDIFLHEYFLTAGRANEHLVSGTTKTVHGGGLPQQEKLIESFRNFSPTLYSVIADSSCPVKPIQEFRVGNSHLNVMAVTTTDDIDKAADQLVSTCVQICREINSTMHLAVWRRYLRTVWLHE